MTVHPLDGQRATLSKSMKKETVMDAALGQQCTITIYGSEVSRSKSQRDDVMVGGLIEGLDEAFKQKMTSDWGGTPYSIYYA